MHVAHIHQKKLVGSRILDIQAQQAKGKLDDTPIISCSLLLFMSSDIRDSVHAMAQAMQHLDFVISLTDQHL
jgi:hypothetical protein